MSTRARALPAITTRMSLQMFFVFSLKWCGCRGTEIGGALRHGWGRGPGLATPGASSKPVSDLPRAHDPMLLLAHAVIPNRPSPSPLDITLVQAVPSRASLRRRVLREPRAISRPSAVLCGDAAAVRLVWVQGIAPVTLLTRPVAVVKLPATRAHTSEGVVGAALRARSHQLQVRDG